MRYLKMRAIGLRSLIGITALVGLSVGGSSLAFAEGGGPFSMSSRGSGGDGPYRSLMLGLPLASTERGPIARVELNIYGKGSLALEKSLPKTYPQARWRAPVSP